MDTTTVGHAPPRFVQPKPWIRWAAVVLAAAGWYVSMQSFRVSAGAHITDPLMQAVCGGATAAGEADNCTAVLTSPQAYVPISRDPGAPRMPVSMFGMGYFALLGLWYLLIGPPARVGRLWHLVVAATVLVGACYSLYYVGIMAYVLHRWCGSCLIAHAINGGLVIVTLLAWPWGKLYQPTAPHPSARLALAALTAGGGTFFAHLAIVFVLMAGSILKQRTAEYAKVLDDPAFVLWDFNRQPAVPIPLYEDEVFAGSATPAHTIVLFSDFQCTHCRQAHETLARVLDKYRDGVRAAFRYYPQDPDCNPNERFRVGGHASGCRAARAAEAARTVGGPEAYARMRELLYERRSQLPTTPFNQQTEQERSLFADWAVELGLDRTAFTEAMESAAVAERIRADIEAADELGIHAMPVTYLDGRRLRNWSKLEVWDALLGGDAAPATQPGFSATTP